jgi:hypothetical protein
MAFWNLGFHSLACFDLYLVKSFEQVLGAVG